MTYFGQKNVWGKSNYSPAEVKRIFTFSFSPGTLAIHHVNNPELACTMKRPHGPPPSLPQPEPQVPEAGHLVDWHLSKDSCVNLMDSKNCLADPSPDGLPEAKQMGIILSY